MSTVEQIGRARANVELQTRNVEEWKTKLKAALAAGNEPEVKTATAWLWGVLEMRNAAIAGLIESEKELAEACSPGNAARMALNEAGRH